jgi:hypothetical protein
VTNPIPRAISASAEEKNEIQIRMGFIHFEQNRSVFSVEMEFKIITMIQQQFCPSGVRWCINRLTTERSAPPASFALAERLARYA